MNLNVFFKLVEIQTKVASVIPFAFGSLYAFFAFDSFSFANAVIMFLSVIIFDMTTTAINNYVDYTKAIKKEGYGYETHNAIVSFGLNPKRVRFLIYFMLLLASVLGFLLFLRTDVVVLFLGMLSFAIGVLYSFGPIPISRTPFGEILSGLAMGFLLTFISIYIHIFDMGIIDIGLSHFVLSMSVNINFVVSIFIVCIPLVCGIANIMLANNICDIEDDIHNKRYTLPIYIGREKSLLLYKYTYVAGYVAIGIGMIFKILPISCIFVFFTVKPVFLNVSKFFELQTKKDTFVLSVKNFVLTNLVYIVSILPGIIASKILLAL